MDNGKIGTFPFENIISYLLSQTMVFSLQKI